MNKQTAAKIEPAVNENLVNEVDLQIATLQQKLKTLQKIIEHPVKDPHIFFYSTQNCFLELTQFHFPFNLSDKVHEAAIEAAAVYQRQLDELQAIKISEFAFRATK